MTANSNATADALASTSPMHSPILKPCVPHSCELGDFATERDGRDEVPAAAGSQSQRDPRRLGGAIGVA